ncbi:TMEM165/GDT1 family protein [Candidatus Woesearchaeota archaeon]|nr:TMEM165/GDT1 family protein [Candidatus Woesearchaeota archaeon]
MISDFLIPAMAVGISEFGDKTQLAVFSLSSRCRSRISLFFAVMVAFLIVDGFAVLFGSMAGQVVDMGIIKLFASAVFIAYGCYTLLGNNDGAGSFGKTAFFSVVGMIFLLELGDKTQVAAILFASQFNPLLVFLGIEFALAFVTLIAIFVFSRFVWFVDKGVMKFISGLLFIVLGFVSLFF